MATPFIEATPINVPHPHSSLTWRLWFQVITYNGFYDQNLEWVGLENVQIVASMNPGNTLGKHTLSTRFTSIARICCIE